MEMKGSVAPVSRDGSAPPLTATKIWDEQYAQRPSWWKGPYDITPIIQHLEPGARVLDVGCGSGRYLIPLVRNGFEAVGVDISRQALRLLGCQFARVVADVRFLPFSDRQFDAITCYGLLQHLSLFGRMQAVTELFRVLKQQGLALVEVVGRSDMRNEGGTRVAVVVRGGIPYHYFSTHELLELFQSAGFELLTLEQKNTKKRYAGVVRKRHRILAVMRKPHL